MHNLEFRTLNEDEFSPGLRHLFELYSAKVDEQIQKNGKFNVIASVEATLSELPDEPIKEILAKFRRTIRAGDDGRFSAQLLVFHSERVPEEVALTSLYFEDSVAFDEGLRHLARGEVLADSKLLEKTRNVFKQSFCADPEYFDYYKDV